MTTTEDRIRQLLDGADLPWEALLAHIEQTPLPAERRAAVERALAAEPELARFVEEARTDRLAVAQLLDDAEALMPPGALEDALAQWERQQLIGEARSPSAAWRMVRRLALAAGVGLLATVAVVAGRRALTPAARQAPQALQEQRPLEQQGAPGVLADAAGALAAEHISRPAPQLRARSAANRSDVESSFEGAFPVAARPAGTDPRVYQSVSQASRLVRALSEAEQALPYARQGRLALVVEAQRPADLLVALTELSGASEGQTRFLPDQQAFAYAVSEQEQTSPHPATTLGVLTLPADRAALATTLLLARETGRARFVPLRTPLDLPQSAWRTDQAWWRGSTSDWRPLAAVQVRLAPGFPAASPGFSPGERPVLGEPLHP